MARKKNDKYAKYRRNSKEKRKKNHLFAGIVLVILVVMILIQLGMYREKQRLEAQKKEVQQQISEEEDRTKELEKKKEYMDSNEYIEKIAREKFGLFYPDEYILEEE